MIIEEALFAFLSTSAPVQALVAARIYPLQPPQEAVKPYVVYSKITSPPVRTFGGLQGGEAHIDFTCTADGYLAAKGVKKAVQDALEAWTEGVMGGPGGVVVRAALKQNEVDLYDPQTRLYHTVLEVAIWHEGE